MTQDQTKLDWEIEFHKQFGEGINFMAYPSPRVKEFIKKQIDLAHNSAIDQAIKYIKKWELEDYEESIIIANLTKLKVDMSNKKNKNEEHTTTPLKEKSYKCDNCADKGYNTVLDFATGGNYRQQNPIYRPCRYCDRGKDIKKLIEEAKSQLNSGIGGKYEY